MTYRVLALASGVTGLEDHRLALNTLAFPNGGGLKVYGGVVPGGFGLTNPSAMTARVASGFALIPGTGTATQGAYLFVSDANVDLVFDNGEAGVARTDRIIARVYDNTYDSTGFTKGEINYLKGQSSGAATTLPANSILLYEQVVAAGASSGGTPINFGTVTDKRQQLSAVGGIQSVASATERDALNPSYNGKMIYRRDRGWLERQDTSNVWRALTVATVADSGALNQISSPYAGQLATFSANGQVVVYNGSNWVNATDAGNINFRASRTSSQSIPSGTATTVIFPTVAYNNGFTYNTSTGVLTVPANGIYSISARTQWDFSSVSYREIYLNINNGSSLWQMQGWPLAGDAGASPTVGFSTDVNLTAGDTVRIQAKQGRGSALNVVDSTFTCRRVGSV